MEGFNHCCMVQKLNEDMTIDLIDCENIGYRANKISIFVSQNRFTCYQYYNKLFMTKTMPEITI